MKTLCSLALALIMLVTAFAPCQDVKPAKTKAKAKTKILEKSFSAANNLTIKVRATKPQDLDTDLQIIGYFKHNPSGDTVLSVLIDIDKMLGGLITSLRDRGAFVGNELETLTFTPPKGIMRPKKIMLIGYGDAETFSLDRLPRIGTVALREAVRMRAARVAFAPALRDQGSNKFGTGDVERENVKAIILAYDTEKRLQKEGLAREFTLMEFIVEAGPEFFKDTIAGVAKGVEAGNAEVAARNKKPYMKK
jgi:hypothetical protein